MRVVEKKLSRDLSLRRRHKRLTAQDSVQSEKLKKLLLVLALQLRDDSLGEAKREEKRRLFRVVYARYLHGVYIEEDILPRPERFDRTIDSFSDSDCYIFFRFTKEHLHELKVLLGFTGIAEFVTRRRWRKKK